MRMDLLLIHTGGTIGMVPTANGLAPQKGVVEDAIAARLPAGVTLHQHVFDPLLDSADVGPNHWNEILSVLSDHPNMAAIVTHGTDTMSFTGAALSQALAGLDRRVILCGSMQPLNTGGDAEGNLDLALDAALNHSDTGVYLSFAAKLLPADGLTKYDSHADDAFRHIPQAPLAAPTRRQFDAKRLAIVTLTPDFPVAALSATLSELDGAVLRVFGAGTAMNNPALYDALKSAIAEGKRIRAVSQSTTGGLEPGAYAAGSALWAAGVENGGLETPEAALIHLWLN